VVPDLFLMYSSLRSFWNFSFLPYDTNLLSFHPNYTSLHVYLTYQYILSHLSFACHGVAYVRVRRLVLTTIGTMVFIDDNNLINKRGTKTI